MAVQAAKAFDCWSTRDREGHREYHIVHKVQTTTPLRYVGAAWQGDGPESISSAADLPVTGDFWNYGNDSDAWAFCLPTKSIRPIKEGGGPVQFYTVESVFSTKPLDRCMSDRPDDPLDEPQRVRGNSIRYTIEAYKDRNGDPIMSSSHEMFRGPQVEFDGGRDQVTIEQNVADLELGLCTSLRNNLNDDVLWNLQARRIKLSDFSWEELWYGTCIYYYKRIFTFDIRNDPEDLFDRLILDEGTKVLNGRWDETTGLWVDVDVGGSAPDKDNPQHFIRYKDRNEENARVVLDGKGRPADAITSLGTGSVAGTGTDSGDEAGQHLVEYYGEGDLTQLNIPTDLDFGTATP